MSNEKQMTGQESLQLITEMLQKAKAGFHEKGNSSILWGTVIAICGLVSFAQEHWKFNIGFDIWLLTLIALVPQVIMSVRARRNKKVIGHTEAAVDVVWLVFGISIFALIFYLNVVPGAAERYLADLGLHIYQQSADGKLTPYSLLVISRGSLFLLLYAMPTLATGLITRFKPMTAAAILCYGFFVASCFTTFKYDMLLNGLAGIFNWLIPGLILRKKYADAKRTMNV